MIKIKDTINNMHWFWKVFFTIYIGLWLHVFSVKIYNDYIIKRYAQNNILLEGKIFNEVKHIKIPEEYTLTYYNMERKYGGKRKVVLEFTTNLSDEEIMQHFRQMINIKWENIKGDEKLVMYAKDDLIFKIEKDERDRWRMSLWNVKGDN